MYLHQIFWITDYKSVYQLGAADIWLNNKYGFLLTGLASIARSLQHRKLSEGQNDKIIFVAKLRIFVC